MSTLLENIITIMHSVLCSSPLTLSIYKTPPVGSSFVKLSLQSEDDS